MKDEEILKKALSKAWGKSEWDIPEMMVDEAYYSTIFSHDFAKAFWGEENWHFGWDGNAWKWHEGNTFKWSKGTNLIMGAEAWQYHLQQMALEEEPLKYLKKFLGKAA